MTPKLILAADPVRVVVVTMDSHLSGAAARAEATLQYEQPGLSLTVHAADEWGSDPQALAACLTDIAQGDVVIATMLFLEDHIRPVQAALAARRDSCDAMLCCMSANEITRLTRLGRFDMAQEATGALAMLKKLRGGKKGERGTNGVGSDGRAHAAPPAQADEVHPRHRPGRPDLLPRPAILARRLGRKPRQPGPHARRPLLRPALAEARRRPRGIPRRRPLPPRDRRQNHRRPHLPAKALSRWREREQ